ncbi:MAG: hypothetical protein J6T64_10175, partial [Bacteroidaceae bacterium]|nr:hypothetical protein [Bacteroidaceae bacterium]
PKMPSLGKGTECIKILLSQVSNDIREPLVPMLFPILGAHISDYEFQFLYLIGRVFVANRPFHSQKMFLLLTDKGLFT